MPRWLIAVFTLHFLFSVGASAFGKTPATELPLPQSVPAIQAIAVAAAQADPAPSETASLESHEHGLTDANQELPDDQSVRLPLVESGCTSAIYLSQTAAEPRSPALKRQLRPPRASHVLRA